MNFNTANYKQEDKKFISPVFQVGFNRAKVENVEIKTASTGSKSLLFRLYGEPVTIEGFKPFKKADGVSLYHGQVGQVKTNYFKQDDEKAIGMLMQRVINPLTKALGIQSQFDDATATCTDLESFVALLNTYVTNPELPYVLVNLSGEEYEKIGSAYPGVALQFRNIVSVDADVTKLTEGVLKKLAPKEASADEGSLY